MIAAEPAVVHFGGFQPGVTITQIVRLCNISSNATRVHVVAPDSESFKASTDLAILSVMHIMHPRLVFTIHQARAITSAQIAQPGVQDSAQ